MRGNALVDRLGSNDDDRSTRADLRIERISDCGVWTYSSRHTSGGVQTFSSVCEPCVSGGLLCAKLDRTRGAEKTGEWRPIVRENI